MNRLSKSPTVILLGLLAVFLGGCGTEAEPPLTQEQPNILFIVAEDMSSRVGAFGDEVAMTPTIDALAESGISFPNTFTASGVCAPSRSALITGVYPTSMGTHHMRTASGVPGSSVDAYEAVPPADVKAFPELLRAAGYATVNFAKKDYQFGEPFTIWDADIGDFMTPVDPATWRQLPDDKPFFAMVNLLSTHETRLVTVDGGFPPGLKAFAEIRDKMVPRVTDPADVAVPAYFPDTDDVRSSIAQHYDNIHFMDSEVAKILAALEEDGLADNTIVIWTTDHGDAFPRAKRSAYDSGTRVPMIVRFPDGRGANSVRENLVSFVDLAPTILRLAGVEVPSFMQGRDFLEGESREFVYASRDRMDETLDRQRSVRDEQYRYVRNYMPELAYFRPLQFRDMFPIMKDLWAGSSSHNLSDEQNFYFAAPRPTEELYDLSEDPDEVNNLAGQSGYEEALVRMRNALAQWQEDVGDWGNVPEIEMVGQMWPELEQPVTSKPQADQEPNNEGLVRVTFSSTTEGASIGYRIDEGSWELYTGPVSIGTDQTLQAKAIRYGYKESAITTVSTKDQAELSTREIALIGTDGFEFRDLNKNGALDNYEDWRLSAGERAADLLARMTLEEKIGQIAHGNIWPNAPFGAPATGYDLEDAEAVMSGGHITAFIPFATLNYLAFVEQNNAIQEIAERGRLGIPATISTDPRHHFMSTVGASTAGEGFSQWPEPLGFAALNDEDLVTRFAQIAAREYRATGFSQALSPQADLATEPRWTRIYHTFGEDPNVAARMVGAYIRGFQGGDDGVREGNVSTVVKHWVGYGAAKDGFDSHNYYGRFGDLGEEDLDTHITPFEQAFAANVAGVMPAYSIFEGLTVNGEPIEPVGAAYSKVMIDGLLRQKYDFGGFVLSDWAITADCPEVCRNGRPPGAYPDPDAEVSTAWGVLELSRPERFALAMAAGVDQFGGVNDVSPILAAVAQGLISEERIDQSVLRILRKTFATGLFESPFANPENAAAMVNTAEVHELALEVQSKAMVVLKRDLDGPLIAPAGQSVFLFNAESSAFEEAGYKVASNVGEADVAIFRLSAPYETLHPNYFFGMQQHEGSLAFDPEGEEMQALRDLKDADARVIVDVALDRPAILTDIAELADTLIVNFGASDLALLRALDGTVKPTGRLPFELPSSMEAVERQASGKPADSDDPLFPLHYAVDRKDQ